MNRIIPLSFMLVFFAIHANVQSQVNPVLADSLQAILDEYTESDLHGVSATLILPDGCMWTGVSGEAGPGDPVDMVRKWHFASTTKAMTAAIAFQLVDEGILNLDDSIGMYINTDTINYVDGDITIRMLLNHTTDLDTIWDGTPPTPLWSAVWSKRDSVWNIHDVLDYTFPQVPNPDHEHRYLGVINYLLLGFAIESATGNSLATEFQNRIFDPLGMTHSFLSVDGIDMTELNGVWNGVEYRGDWPHDSYMSTRGAGGWLVSTTEDVTIFMNAFHNDQLASSGLMEEARTSVPGTPGPVPPSCLGSGTVHYGMGTQIVRYYLPGTNDTILLVGHGGLGLANSLTLHHLENNITLSVVTNEYTLSAVLYNTELFGDILCFVLNNLALTNCLTGIEEMEQPDMKIWPNPGTDELHVMLDQTYNQQSVQLISITGQLVAETKYDGHGVYFNTGALPDGMYFVRFVSPEGIKVMKWVKE